MKISFPIITLGSAGVLAGALMVPGAAQADTLKERQQKVTVAVAKGSPAVVAIQRRQGRAMGSGSGVIVSADGIILTAAHVVDATVGGDGADEEVAVVLPDGREVKARVLGRDRNRDAAMIQITEGGKWPFVELAPANSIQQGEWCIAMGHQGGFDPQRGAPVRLGRLWLNNDRAFYRSDCTVSGGDSGGPLFDLEGRVIGIHSSISMNLTENRHVPVGVFHDDWDRLKKGEVWGNANRVLSEADDLTPKKRERSRLEKRDERAESKPLPRGLREPAEPAEPKPAGPAKGAVWLGIEMKQVEDGVMVLVITQDSPAKKAGLEVEDVITKVDGKAVGSTGDVASRVHESAPGDKLKLTVKRDGKEKNLEVTLTAHP